MTMLEPNERGRRRRFRAWIFTPHLSRYRFVYPCFAESTETAIEACEAAWEFYDGVFGVVVPDNTKAIVHTADPLKPRIIDEFLEYAQARGFHIDPTRVRHPKDKARTERAVRDVRDDCFAGEKLLDIDGARARGRHWCAEEYGMRRHTTTCRHRRSRVPDPPGSPVTRDPPGGARTVLRLGGAALRRARVRPRSATVRGSDSRATRSLRRRPNADPIPT
jgi:hypothetical protein